MRAPPAPAIAPILAGGEHAPLLVLNNTHAAALSLLDAAGFAHLVGEAFMASRIGVADALMIALDQNATYDSPNFLWFKQRYARFVYVDRVAVDVAMRGRGLARALYEALFDSARAAGHEVVLCEVNAQPPNPTSDAFHASLGFVVVGSTVQASKGRAVRYFARPLS